MEHQYIAVKMNDTCSTEGRITIENIKQVTEVYVHDTMFRFTKKYILNEGLNSVTPNVIV